MRARLLILASTISAVGWGTVLPYQYAYATETRGWSAMTAAVAASLFSIGALIAAPIGGRLTDRISPVVVAVVSRLVGAAGLVALVVLDSREAFFAGLFIFGMGMTAAAPASQVLVLRWVGTDDRRRVFAWVFTGQALGMALGAVAAGSFVDLNRSDGMAMSFYAAATGLAVAAMLVALAGWRMPEVAPDAELDPDRARAPEGLRGLAVLRLLWQSRPLRWTALVTISLALGFYAQFESGLPAYALTSLSVEPSTIGLAAAVNCIVIIALQMVIVKVTANRGAPALLMGVAAFWVAGWIILSLARLLPGGPAMAFVLAYGVFAVGETMYAPVLSPLTANLAPEGLVGTTLGIFAALQTGISAAGPLIAGIMLGAGWANAFLLVHLGISAIAGYAAWQLRRSMRPALAAKPPVAVPHTGGSWSVDESPTTSPVPYGASVAI